MMLNLLISCVSKSEQEKVAITRELCLSNWKTVFIKGYCLLQQMH